MDPEKLHYYQLRYDSWNIDHFKKLEANYLNIVGYVLGFEKKADGTKHIQAMILNEFKLTPNEKTKFREAIRRKIKKEFNKKDKELDNSVSITNAKFPHALLNYCTKTNDTDIDLDEEQITYIKSLPLNNKNQWKTKLDDFIKTFKKNITKAQFYTKICHFYIENDRSLPRKQQLLTLAVRFKKITYDTYLSDLGITWSKGYDSDYSDSDEQINNNYKTT